MKDVILTHLHYDHVGSFDQFPQADFHLQESEMHYACGRFMRFPKLAHSFEPDDIAGMVKLNFGRRVRMINGDADIAPGINKPIVSLKAQKLFVGGYSRSASHDTRLRLALEILEIPYTMVTGFPGTADINKAMLQNEVNFSGSSLPGYQTQVIPQIINAGIGIPIYHYPAMAADGSPLANPSLEKQGIVGFDKLYMEAKGKAPSGPKYDALMLMDDIGTQFQRGIVLPKGAPADAVADMRKGFDGVAADADFKAEYRRVTGEDPELVRAAELEPLFQRMRNIDPAIKKVLKESVGE